MRLLLDKLDLQNMVFILEDWGSLLGLSYIVDRQDKVLIVFTCVYVTFLVFTKVAGYVMWETLTRICGSDFDALGICSSKYHLPWELKYFPLTRLITHCFRYENYLCSECINIDLEYFFNATLPLWEVCTLFHFSPPNECHVVQALPDRERCYKLDNMTVEENEGGIEDLW